MPYIKKTYRYKNVIEVERVHAGRIGKGGRREERKLPTPEEMEKINERNVIRKLRRLIHANFEPEDLWLTLTYRRENRPAPEAAARKIKNYIDRLRAAWRKQGAELKYIVVTEYKNKAIHHHLILNDLPNGRGAKLAAQKWKEGGTHCKFIYEDGEYELLAAYIVKETNKSFRDPDNPAKCRYSRSRNLVEPQPERRVMKRDDWPEEPRPPKGFCLDKESLHNGVNRLGYKYQYYRLLRLQGPAGKKGKGNGDKGRKRKNNTERDAGD